MARSGSLIPGVLAACLWLAAPAVAGSRPDADQAYVPADADQAPAPAGGAAPKAAPDRKPAPDEQIDVWDYLRKLRKKDAPAASTEEQTRRLAVVIVPVVSSKPSSGFALGAGASLEQPLGDLRDTFVSSMLISFSISTKGFYTVALRPMVYGPANRWLLSGDNHFQKSGQETYDLGTGASGESLVEARYTSLKFVDTYYRQVGKGVFAGAGLQYQRYSDIGPIDGEDAGWDESAFVQYSRDAGFDLSAQTAAGLNVAVRRDSRDNVSDPGRGWFAEAILRAHMADFLGGTSTFQRLYLDARTYRPITKDGRQKLAFWTFADIVTGGTAPYLSLPTNGADPMGRSARGYAEGRFRGDRLVYGEVEYRVPLRRDGLVGMVAFLNATTVGSTYAGESLFDSVALGAGFGFRLRLQKRSRTNVCLDFGWGREGSRGVYIALAEAF